MQDYRIESFFDPATATVTHLVFDPVSRCAGVIDSVLDYDPKSGRTSHTSADRVLDSIRRQGLQLQWLLETHAHADHFSAAPYLKDKLGGKVAIGRQICEVQTVFRRIFNDQDLDTEGRDFDQLLDDGDVIRIGELQLHVMHTPGHTCLLYTSPSPRDS